MRIVSLIPSRGSKKDAAADDDGSIYEHDDDKIFMTGGLEMKKAASAFRHAPTGDGDEGYHDEEREPPSFSGRCRADMDVFLPATGPVEHEKGLGRCASPPTTTSMNNSKRKFPKEKWVKPAAKESIAAVLSGSFESIADYRKRCSQSNKHPIDKHIKEEPRIRYHNNIEQREKGAEDDRYRSASPIRSQSSSDDGIAQWRSSDDEDDKNSGDDWDMKMEDPALAVIMVPNIGGTDADTATVTSLEMIHFDPQKVQVLGTEHRFHPNGAVSFQSNDGSRPNNKKKGSKAFWSKRLSKSRFLAQNKKQAHSAKHTPSRPTKGRTMSSLSNSGSSGSFDSDDSDDETRESCEVEQSRAQSRNGTKVSLLDEESDEEEDEDGQSDCSASSGSLSEGEQKRYRKERRAEHRRRLWKKRWEQFVPTMSKHIEEEEEDEDSRYGDDKLPPTTITTPRQTQSARYPAIEQKKNPIDQKANGGILSFLRRNESPPLPWEEDKPANSHGLFGTKKQIRSVDDLPFPRSESLDGSLLEVRDKYRDIFEELEVLEPPPAHIQVDSQEATVQSSTIYSAGSAKKPIRRRTQKGLGHAARKLFLRR